MTTECTTAGAPAAFAVRTVERIELVRWMRSWCGTPERPRQAEIAVREGYGSPYRFAGRLRQMVGDENAEVYCVRLPGQTVYWATDAETRHASEQVRTWATYTVED